MHLFFDTDSVWKLHIGEIPEKPNPKNYLYPGPLVSDLKQYEHAIAAIKQNALTVWNPEIIKKEVSIREWYHDNQPVPDRFYFWPWGYETKETPENRDGRLVAILKLPEEHVLTKESISSMKFKPEEKKNTMENMTKEQQWVSVKDRLPEKNGLYLIHKKPDPDRRIEYLTDVIFYCKEKPFNNLVTHWMELPDRPTSSGSVAAPKELNEDQKLVHEVHEAHDLAGNAIDKLFDRLSSLKELVREREEELTILYQDLNEREAECKTLKEGIRKGSELYANLKFDDEPTGYQIALKKIQEREEALKELLPIAEKKFNATSHREYIALKAIINRARKLLSK